MFYLGSGYFVKLIVNFGGGAGILLVYTRVTNVTYIAGCSSWYGIVCSSVNIKKKLVKNKSQFI